MSLPNPIHSFCLIGRYLAACVASLAVLANAAETAGESPLPPENSFIRFVENEKGGKLETSVTSYENANGTTVDLIGTIHLADAKYYEGLNASFKEYQIVLYELVGQPFEKKPGAGKHVGPAAPPANAALLLGKSQITLANLLKLQHQVISIDYTAPNLIHADVDWETFRALQKAKGESFATLLRKSLKAQKAIEKEMKNQGAALPEEDDTASLLALVSATRGSDASGLKLILARQFEHAERIMGQLEMADGTVIIAERNKVALAKLGQQIQAGNRKLGIFYGAGHLPDMEKRLLASGFKHKKTTWRTAWDIPKPKLGSRLRYSE